MSENLGRIAPVDWRGLVKEAIRRRRAEKLTQREHAALASVSIPTIVAFDRGELTLSLAKSFDILRVVGLVTELPDDSSQEIFVRDAYERWRALTAKLPKDSPARFPHGSYRVDYGLEGDLREVEPAVLLDMLRKVVVRHTGWPMFVTLTRPELAPHEVDGVIECWLPPREGDIDRLFHDAASCDFWRAAPTGRLFLLRGYDEDSQDTIPPGSIFDTILPIWRLGEALLHGRRLAKLLARDDSTVNIHVRALYSGLTGRTLRAWSNPLSGGLLLGSRPPRSDEALVELKVSTETVDNNLALCVLSLVTPLYERFGVTGISIDGVRAELDRMRQNKFGRDEMSSA